MRQGQVALAGGDCGLPGESCGVCPPPLQARLWTQSKLLGPALSPHPIPSPILHFMTQLRAPSLPCTPAPLSCMPHARSPISLAQAPPPWSSRGQMGVRPHPHSPRTLSLVWVPACLAKRSPRITSQGASNWRQRSSRQTRARGLSPRHQGQALLTGSGLNKGLKSQVLSRKQVIPASFYREQSRLRGSGEIRVDHRFARLLA